LIRILSILSFILLISLQSQAQSSGNTPVSDVGDRIIKLYPNPATSYITFDLQKNFKRGFTIHIYNGVLGKKVHEVNNVPERTTVDLTDFSRGVYIYQLIDQTGKIIESGKFQVSR
jgi:Secretion system C-terminal sorting domain